MKLKDVPMPPIRLMDLTEAVKAREEGLKAPQAASTQAILRRDPLDDASAAGRTVTQTQMEAYVEVNPQAQQRDLDLEQVAHVESARRRPKNSRFQSMLSSVTAQKIRSAIFAYLTSPGTTILTSEEQERVFTYTNPNAAWSEEAKSTFAASATQEEFKEKMVVAGLKEEAEQLLAYVNRGKS